MYRLRMRRRAQQALAGLDTTVARRVRNKLREICENCDNPDYPHKALRGIHRGKFSSRAAKDYRILYTLDPSTREVIVHEIGHRSEVY